MQKVAAADTAGVTVREAVDTMAVAVIMREVAAIVAVMSAVRMLAAGGTSVDDRRSVPLRNPVSTAIVLLPSGPRESRGRATR